ncbi:oligosaccharide flippase family protein [Geodermatophilus sp. URMC 63]
MAESAWLVLGIVVNRTAGLLTTVVLARLLAPVDFGAFALAWSIAGALLVLGDLGLSASLISRPESSRQEERLLAGTMVLVAALLGSVGLVAGAVLEVVSGDGTGALVAALAAVFGASGYSGFLMAWVRRRLRFRTVCAGQVLQALTSAAASIGAALLGWGVWSFIAGQAGGVLVLTVFLALAARGGRALALRIRPALAHVREARAFLAQGGIGFLSQNVDNYVVGLLNGKVALGYYSMAYRLSELPYVGLADPMGQALFATAAQEPDEGRRRRLLLGTVAVVAGVVAPAMLLLCVHAPVVVRVVLGERWVPMTGILQVLAVWGLLRAVQGVFGWYLNGVGHAGWMARFAACLLPLSGIAIVIGAVVGGPLGVALAMVLDMAVSTVVLAARVVAVHRLPVSALGRAAATQGLALLAMGVSVLPFVLSGYATGWPSLVVAVVVPLLVYVLALAGAAVALGVPTWLGLVRLPSRRTTRPSPSEGVDGHPAEVDPGAPRGVSPGHHDRHQPAPDRVVPVVGGDGAARLLARTVRPTTPRDLPPLGPEPEPPAASRFQGQVGP